MNPTYTSFRLNVPPLIRNAARTSNTGSRPQTRAFNALTQPRRPPPAPRIKQTLAHSVWRRSPRTPRITRAVRFNSSKPSPNPTPNLGSPEPPLTYSQRFRKLGREYGWSAMGIYFALSALDFPFCFLAVRLLGTERIGHWEHVVVESFWKIVEIPFPNIRQSDAEAQEMTAGGDVAIREGGGWGVEEAEAENQSDRASIWTQLALAYAIHKSFIFIRVPITVAITPKVVKTLRGWGWDIGKRKVKAPGKP